VIHDTALRTIGRVSFRALMRPLALANLVANIALVVTGAAVRLTGSGLGCPTWPKCTDGSYTTTTAMGVLAVACFVAALLQRPRRRSLVWLSFAAGLYIPAQAVIGGITVLTDLNPWVVGLHFLLSIGLIALTWALWQRTAEGDGPRRFLVSGPLLTLSRLTALAAAAVIVAGVIVTGSGPHAGDADARRTGLDPAAISQAHADLVMLLIGLTVGLWLALRAAGAPRAAVRAALVLLVIELAQGLIGFVQYFTHLPVILVGFHMLGAALVWTGTLAVLWRLRDRGEPIAATAPAAPVADTAAAEPPVHATS
jgi:cytochrome c oxidase assembly protein subunit 15